MGDRIKKASIISIGNEVVCGRTIDTNAAHISRQLLAAGIPVAGVYVVGDRIEAITRVLQFASEEAQIIICSGGLGPTDDDLTRQALADFLGVELELRDELLVQIERYFERIGVKMAARNKIQACIPKGADAIANEWGTAPGIAAHKGVCQFFALPGVPREMEKMLQASVLGQLRSVSSEQAIVVKRLRCFGEGESTIAERLGDAMDRDRNPLVNCTVGSGGITLEIVSTASVSDVAEARAAETEQALRQVLGGIVYGVDDETLAEVVGNRLARRGQTVATAESCTGGLVAKLITDVPGASRYFTRGWVTYSNEAKTAELAVAPELIAQYGAVSAEVAAAMAQGARRAAAADYAIAITGIAGPDGGTEQKPVGLVYVAVDHQGGTDTSQHVFPHERSAMRRRTALTALDRLRRQLES